jgi:hypothetical protein
MSFHARSAFAKAPRNLCDLFLRDLNSLLVTSRTITRSLLALRPECEFSPEITEKINDLIATSRDGESHLRGPLREAGIILPTAVEGGANALVASFFTRVPAGVAPEVLATEVAVNLRLLSQHLELKTHLAAEEALLVGQKSVCRALLAWARKWCACGEKLRATTLRARAQAYFADIGNLAPQQGP